MQEHEYAFETEIEQELGELHDRQLDDGQTDEQSAAEDRADVAEIVTNMIMTQRPRVETGLALSLRRGQMDLTALEDRLGAIIQEFAVERVRMEGRQQWLTETMERCIDLHFAETTNRMIRLPGIGEFSRRAVTGKWRVADADAAVDWLREEGETEGLLIPQEPKLDKNALLLRRESLMKDYGGEIVDGLERGEDGASYTFKFD